MFGDASPNFPLDLKLRVVSEMHQRTNPKTNTKMHLKLNFGKVNSAFEDVFLKTDDIFYFLPKDWKNL